jgi:hypothetical protein
LIDNQSKEVQKIAVKKNWKVILWIENPSEEVQKLAVKQDGSAIFLYIDNEESSKDGDIYLALAKNKVYSTPFSLKGLVNSKDEESHDDQNNGINRCQSDAIGFSNRA